MDIYTMGFTQKTAEQFFEKIKKNEIEILVDVRITAGRIYKRERFVIFFERIMSL